MKKSIRAFACWGLALLAGAAGLYADTIPGGDVYGTWYVASSPYYIEGNITIPTGNTLIIEPGVMVDFLGNYSFTVNGWLEAVGTEADSIWFAGGWWGFYFNGAPSSSSLEYCSISGALRGIKTLGSSSPGISHCRFSNNINGICWESTSDATISDCVISDNTELGGVDMHWSLGNLTMVDCVISDNVSSYEGAGVRVSNGTVNSFAGCKISGNWSEQRGAGVSISGSASVAFTDCTISDNYSNVQQGGGVALTNGSTATFTDCAINGNTGFNMVPPYDNGGGGISLVDASATLSHCTVFDNYTIEYGGGIAVTNGNLVLDHCTISGNQSNDDKSGISIAGSGSTSDITNSIISYNNYPGSTPSYGIYNQGSLMVEYSDFYGNEGGDILGNVPSGFGELDRVNLNGDSCDCYYDIFMDPMFADTAGGDFHLLAGSPCIDAGDPAFACDPDSTVTDMGAYWYDQRAPAAALSDTVLDFGGVTVGGQADLGLVVYNLGTANLMISGLANSLPVFTTNYDPADSLVPPGDSLALTVTFAPSDTFPVGDTLIIANNDHSLTVALSGTGLPTGVAGRPEPALPKAFALHPCRPNPARGFTSISYQLPKECRVALEVYSITGQLVKRFDEGVRLPGYYSVSWNTARQPAGVYFYRLKAGSFAATKKLVVIR